MLISCTFSPATDENSDDDEMSIKPTKKTKTQVSLKEFFDKRKAGETKRPVVSPSRIAAMKPKSKAPAKKAPAKKVVKSEDESDFEAVPPPKSKATGTKKAPAKKSVLSDDDEDMDSEPAAKETKRAAAPRRAARVAPKKYIDVSEEDDAHDDTFEISDSD